MGRPRPRGRGCLRPPCPFISIWSGVAFSPGGAVSASRPAGPVYALFRPYGGMVCEDRPRGHFHLAGMGTFLNGPDNLQLKENGASNTYAPTRLHSRGVNENQSHVVAKVQRRPTPRRRHRGRNGWVDVGAHCFAEGTRQSCDDCRAAPGSHASSSSAIVCGGAIGGSKDYPSHPKSNPPQGCTIEGQRRRCRSDLQIGEAGRG